MDEEDKLSPREFYYPEDLKSFDVETETGITECHNYNKQLTNWACLRHTGEYWPEVREVHTATTEG